jgi:hypothetical protein
MLQASSRASTLHKTMRDPTDKLIGHVHVLCKLVDAEFPFAVAWQEAFEKKDGRKYATIPSSEFYRRGHGGVRHKVLVSTFVPLRRVSNAVSYNQL